MDFIVISADDWEREKDKKSHTAFCKILKEMLHSDPSSGSGKPEPLKHNLSGLWSKIISQKDRLIYKFDDEYLYIFAIGGITPNSIKI